MAEPLALFNGRLVHAAQVAVPVYDAGFVLGAAVSEQLRTFAGRLFKLDDHLARLARGLTIAEIDPGVGTAQFAAWAEELTAANHRLLAPGDDLGLSIFVTPGPYAALAPPDAPRSPTIGMTTYPLPFHFWADKYESGEHLAVSAVRQVPVECWPRELKCRSRIHYYLAEKDVARRVPGARPLLLDAEGRVNETPTANIAAIRGGELAAPPEAEVLPGISMRTIAGLAAHADLSFVERSFAPSALHTADEALVASTPFCLLPVTKLDGQAIGDGRPGAKFRNLLAAWSDLVGLDIAEQARRFATRAT